MRARNYDDTLKRKCLVYCWRYQQGKVLQAFHMNCPLFNDHICGKYSLINIIVTKFVLVCVIPFSTPLTTAMTKNVVLISVVL